MEDLWLEKRRNYKFEIFASLPDIETDSPKKSEYKEFRVNPIIQQRKMFKLPDYKNPIYQEPDFDIKRLNFPIPDNPNSESRNRRNQSKLSFILGLVPLNHRPSSSRSELDPKSQSLEMKRF